jgi:hypothetical protein
MLEIALIQTANQTFNVDLENLQFAITIKEANGVMIADIAINGETVILGTRVLAGEPIIPYEYLQDGNLVLSTLENELPYWELFGVSQTLLYLTNEEMTA